ncbi:hypothetical protein SEUBUCD646_0J03400 [Saccharomyces eubayanus]|uniref:Uncharacterized protein n=2 Tax=Saccharomyces TaxID=4930 RepID=A0A6C1DUZ5_SACPS|nr:hypothetical protein GRS66_002930 [Saccharomyces pastorianus]CAI1526178.1 hypothetical protein SEUBUCD650_0J03390 [Saccharomyces eubayanus]CAI1546954.1 hypothetical protein SEUBUCD646_0J03400 [Saccharomyces eubayanus]
MVKITTAATAVALATSAAATSATTTLSPYDERVNLVELAVYVSDIRAHLADYYAFQGSHPTETYPPEIASAVFNYGEFTTMLTGISGDEVTRMITGVPWYSTRLKAAIAQALSDDGIYTALPTSTSTSAETTASSAETTASSVEVTSSNDAVTSASGSVVNPTSAASSPASAASVASSTLISSVITRNGNETSSSTSNSKITSVVYGNNATLTATKVSTDDATITSCKGGCTKEDTTSTKTQLSTVETTVTSCSAGVCSTLTAPITTATSSASHAIEINTNGAHKFGNGGVLGAAIIAGAAALL